MNDSKEIEVILLVADLSGYTALTEAHGNISAAKVVNRYTEIAKESLCTVWANLKRGRLSEVLIKFFLPYSNLIFGYLAMPQDILIKRYFDDMFWL